MFFATPKMSRFSQQKTLASIKSLGFLLKELFLKKLFPSNSLFREHFVVDPRGANCKHRTAQYWYPDTDCCDEHGPCGNGKCRSDALACPSVELLNTSLWSLPTRKRVFSSSCYLYCACKFTTTFCRYLLSWITAFFRWLWYLSAIYSLLHSPAELKRCFLVKIYKKQRILKTSVCSTAPSFALVLRAGVSRSPYPNVMFSCSVFVFVVFVFYFCQPHARPPILKHTLPSTHLPEWWKCGFEVLWLTELLYSMFRESAAPTFVMFRFENFIF